jgi:hypothetical protein
MDGEVPDMLGNIHIKMLKLKVVIVDLCHTVA